MNGCCACCRRGRAIALWLGLAVTAAASPASENVKQALKDTFRYQPPPAAGATNQPASTDPDLWVLDPIRVQGKKELTRDEAFHLGSRTEMRKKYAKIYSDEVDSKGTLNSLLNSVTIPILSPSKAERGRALRLERQMKELNAVP